MIYTYNKKINEISYNFITFIKQKNSQSCKLVLNSIYYLKIYTHIHIYLFIYNLIYLQK